MPFRPIPQPEIVSSLLSNVGNFDKVLTNDSMACNNCYLLCTRLVQQCDEDPRSTETIIQGVRVKVGQLREECSRCIDNNEFALLRGTIILGEYMLSNRAMTFPQLYSHYQEHLHSSTSPYPK